MYEPWRGKSKERQRDLAAQLETFISPALLSLTADEVMNDMATFHNQQKARDIDEELPLDDHDRFHETVRGAIQTVRGHEISPTRVFADII